MEGRGQGFIRFLRVLVLSEVTSSPSLLFTALSAEWVRNKNHNLDPLSSQLWGTLGKSPDFPQPQFRYLVGLRTTKDNQEVGRRRHLMRDENKA